MHIWQDYRIAANYDVAIGSLTNIETIKPSGDYRYFVVLNSFASYDPGVLRIRGDGTGYFSGYATLIWLFGGMTFKQHKYLRDTYCAGSYTGKVTIYTKTDADFATYSRMDAIINVPKMPDLEKKISAFANVPVKFTRVRAAS